MRALTNHQRIIPFPIGILFLISIAAVSFGRESVKVTAMYFETMPEIVTVTSNVSDGPEGVSGKTVGGMITSQFPSGIVSLKLGDPENFNEMSIPGFIRRNFVFCCGDQLAEPYPSAWFGTDIFRLEDRGVTQQVVDRLFAAGFEAELSPIAWQEATAVFRLCCTIPGPDSANPSETQIVLLDDIIGLRPDEPILIGFPHIDSKKKKTIYWVALLMEKI